MTRRTRVGWSGPVFGVLVTLYVVALLALALVGQFASAGKPWAMATLVWLPLVLPVLQILVMVGGATLALTAHSLQRGTPGRFRLIMTGWAGVTHFVALLSLGIVVMITVGDILLESVVPMDPRSLVQLIPRTPRFAAYGFAALALLSLLDLVGGAIGCWFLVDRSTRKRIWAVVDTGLVLGVIVVSLTLPLFPDEASTDQKLYSSIRLNVTAIFLARLTAWVIPPLLDLVERIDFHPLVAARHLRARKSGFLATIGTLSVLAVAFSSCSLTTTLSVMGGFRNDLKQKILGNNAHVVVNQERGTFDGWAGTLSAVRESPGVIGATPVVSGEVMVTSASNLAGAVLRGIDPASVGQVTDLEHNMRYGRVEYLIDPARLLDLPAEERGSYSPTRMTTRRAPDTEDIRDGGGGVVRDLDAVIDQAIEDARTDESPPDAEGPDGVEGVEAIDRYLRDPTPVSPARDVLPGIIVGAELARTLRLYVGDEVNVVSPFGDLGPSGPMPRSRPFRVAGIFYSGMYEYDMKHAYVTLATAQRFLNTGDAISSIEIKVDRVEEAPGIAAGIRQAIARPELRVQDWQELNKNLFGALALEKLAMFVTLGIAIMVAGFCVFGTLTLMVQEKAREVGILKAMGTSGRSIIGVFMIEGLLIGLFGSTIGLGLGFYVCFFAKNYGVAMDPQVYYIDKLPVNLDPTEFTLVAIASAVVCLLATIFPAVLASRLRPVDALRYD